MDVCHNVDLQRLNTLAVPSRAQYFAAVNSVEDVLEGLTWARGQGCGLNVLGGGSNLVLADQLPGLTLQVKITGKQLLRDASDQVLLRVGAGENWHGFVGWCLQQGFYGLENLALIPGTVGAAPVQNIGAYGVEVGTFIEAVEGIDLQTQQHFSLTGQQCRFSYRDSVFKYPPGSLRIITHVLFRLPRKFKANVEYPALASELCSKKPEAADVFAAVCRIRSSKLPEPEVLPNCGSFFKNPIVSEEHFRQLLQAHPQLPSFPLANPKPHAYRKLAAAWLIDETGWKGQSRYDVAVHSAQALVLTNPAKLGSDKVLALAEDIRASVVERFAVELEMEPQKMGF